jgi:hypothetical protein
MEKEWIAGADGKNLKFKRETLLNYGTNRWALNKASSVGPTSELIRQCSPKFFEDWEKFYFENAVQKKKNGVRITREYFADLGQRLYFNLSERVQNELGAIQEEECIDYIYNLVVNRTYEGYLGEIETIYGQLESELQVKIHSAPDEWDRTYNVDFFVQVGQKYIGLQIKPISSGRTIDYYQWERMHEVNHKRFEEKYGSKVFFVYSTKSGTKKVIHNKEVIDKIREEIDRLKKL